MKNQRGFAILWGILAVIIVAGAAYWYWSQNSNQYKSVATSELLVKQNVTSENQTAANTAQPSQASSVATISVSGMSEYTDSSFGFSFWYPSDWSEPVQVPNDQAGPRGIIGIIPLSNGQVIKTLQLKTDGTDSFFIQELYSPGGIFNAVGAAGITTKFDSKSSQWVDNSNPSNPNVNANFHPTEVTQTMGGLPILESAVVSLSTSTFVTVGSDGDDSFYNILSGQPLIQTIVATNPSIATQASLAQQIQTIKIEQQSYASTNYLHVSPGSGSAPLVVTFTDNVGGTTINFGDGQTSSLKGYCSSGNMCTIAHTYNAPGFYTVFLYGGLEIVKTMVQVNK